jgi:hypothetical protein
MDQCEFPGCKEPAVAVLPPEKCELYDLEGNLQRIATFLPHAVCKRHYEFAIGRSPLN